MASTTDIVQNQIAIITGQLCQNMTPDASDRDIATKVYLAMRIQKIMQGMYSTSATPALDKYSAEAATAMVAPVV